VGRKEGENVQQLQSHINFSSVDRVSIVAAHPKPDMNQAQYIFEYTHDFDRLNTTLKISNQEWGFSSMATLARNTFVGFEAIKHVYLNK
jgi:hypothetical protein